MKIIEVVEKKEELTKKKTCADSMACHNDMIKQLKEKYPDLLLEAKSLNYITNKHKESILQFCGRIVLSDHFRRIARLYEQLDDFQAAKTIYKKAFFSAPWWWKNFLYIILLSLGYKVSTKLIYLGRKYRI